MWRERERKQEKDSKRTTERVTPVVLLSGLVSWFSLVDRCWFAMLPVVCPGYSLCLVCCLCFS